MNSNIQSPWNSTDKLAHAHTLCTRPNFKSDPQKKLGLGTRLSTSVACQGIMISHGDHMTTHNDVTFPEKFLHSKLSRGSLKKCAYSRELMDSTVMIAPLLAQPLPSVT